MKKVYDVDYFIKKFSAIPENMWTICNRGIPNHPRCALGHCWNGFDGKGEEKALCALFIDNGLTAMAGIAYEPDKKYYIRESKMHAVALINNGMIHEYQQSTPKQRVLAALYDIKKASQPKEIVKEKTVYVTVPVGLIEEAKELVTVN